MERKEVVRKVDQEDGSDIDVDDVFDGLSATQED